MPFCRDLKVEYESLKKLTTEFVSSCVKGKQDGNFQHLSAHDLRTLQLQKQALEKARDSLKEKLFVSPRAAEKIMNEGKEGEPRFFGSEAVEAAFGVKLSPKDIPPIRWSKEELKEAKERGEYLILRISHIPDGTLTGTPLTMQTIAERVQPAMTAHIQKKASRDINNWYEVEPFYTEEKPRAGWAIVSKEPLSDSTCKNYLQQTDRIVDEIETLYRNNPRGIPTQYQDAIEELYQQRPDIERALKNSQWQDAAKRLAELSITTLYRHTASEAFYDAVVLNISTKTDFILSNVRTWTSSRSSGGSFIAVGNTDTESLRIVGWEPHARIIKLGVLFSRRWT